MMYRYVWRNNAKRSMLFGRLCRVLIRGRMNSALVEFEHGRREVVSRNALRKEECAKINDGSHNLKY